MGKLTMKHGWDPRALIEYAKVGGPPPGHKVPLGTDRIQDLARVVEAIVDHLEGQPGPVVTVTISQEGALDPQEMAEKVKALLKDIGRNGAAIR